VQSFYQFISESGLNTKSFALQVSYTAFKHTENASEKFFDFNTNPLRTARSRFPGKKYWLIYSFGASFHDPQLMCKIIAGTNPPPNVLPIETGNDFKNAWKAAEEHHLGTQQYRFSLSKDY
jgi:hypothetical protein